MAGNRDWMDDAACRHRPDLDWFDLDCNLEACLHVCLTCPVGDECLDYAVRNNLTEGVWGGEWGYRLQGYIDQGGTHGAG